MSQDKRRAVLVAPADDPRKAEKALASTADEVVLDLEDAVAPEKKGKARELARELVAEFGETRAIAIRVNGLASKWADEDMAMCASVAQSLGSVVVPKTESREDVARARKSCGTPIQALVETARGIRDIARICSAEVAPDTVIIGYADLAADLGRAPDPARAVWHPIQETVLVAARASTIDVIDGPHLTIADDDGFRVAKQWSRALGFDGTWVIHPAQLQSATEIFTPSQEELNFARRVVDAMALAHERGEGAITLDGRMLDEALVVSAQRTLAKGDVR